MDGYEVARRIRRYEKENSVRRAQIIAVSAYAWEDSFPQMRQCGIDHFIAKPVNKKLFIDTIKSFVSFNLSPGERPSGI